MLNRASRASLSQDRAPTFWREATLLSALLLLLAMTRSPYILLEGRFWAEEGHVFYVAIRDATPRISGLFFFFEKSGYASLLANVVVFAATLVPLRSAPLVTAWVSVAVIISIALVVQRALLLRVNEGAHRAVRWFATLSPILVMAGPAAYPETWANAINLHHHLPVLSFVLVAAFPVSEKQGGRVRVLLPFFLGASSPYSAVVGLLDWWGPGGIARGRQRRAAIAASLGFAVQASALIAATRAASVIDERTFTVSPARVVENLVYVLASATIGQDEVLAFVSAIERTPSAGTASATPAMLTYGVVILLAAAVFVTLASVLQLRLVLQTALSLAAIVILVSIAAFQGVGRGRYAVAAVGILVAATLLGFFSARADEHQERVTGIVAVLVALFVTAGVTEFWTLQREVFLSCESCPSWSDQLSEFRDSGADEAEIPIWPEPQWSMRVRAEWLGR